MAAWSGMAELQAEVAELVHRVGPQPAVVGPQGGVDAADAQLVGPAARRAVGQQVALVVRQRAAERRRRRQRRLAPRRLDAAPELARVAGDLVPIEPVAAALAAGAVQDQHPVSAGTWPRRKARASLSAVRARLSR